jgi:cytochrome c2
MRLARPNSTVFWLGWHLFAALAIVWVPHELRAIGIATSRAVWVFSAAMAAAYALTVIVLSLSTAKEAKVRLADLALAAGIGFGSVFLALLLAKFDYPRTDLVVAVGLAPVFIVLSLALSRPLQKIALAVAVFTAIPIVPMLVRGASDSRAAIASKETRLIRTSHHYLVARFDRRFLSEPVTGGGLEQFGDHYLLATGDGRLVLLTWDAQAKELAARTLPHRVPINRDELIAAFARDPRIEPGYFRVADILLQDHMDTFRLFASHAHWDAEHECFTVRVSETVGRYDAFEAAAAPAAWTTLYESAPCLTVKKNGDAYTGYQIGGRIALLDDRTLLIAVGDHGFDGTDGNADLPQDERADYGKVMAVDLSTGGASVYSSGHRNPQGLTVDALGRIWSTEHGPQGGDELNLIVQGRNYGWPLVTLGTNYGQSFWPLSTHQGWHEGFERPIFAWVPSIGISNVVDIRGEGFPRWRGDLLVASMNYHSLWRVRIADGRALFAEQIKIGERVRDVMEDKDGRIVLWTEEAFRAPTNYSVVVIEPAADARSLEGLTSMQRGELAFSQCSGCHRIEDGKSHAIGPDLLGIAGRKTAAAEAYGYSAALRGLSTTWTDANLDAFLAEPQRFAPGTTMAFPGISDPEARAELIEFLHTRKWTSDLPSFSLAGL